MASPGRERSHDSYHSPVKTSVPFPHVDSISRNSSFSRPSPRRGSTASSVLSIGPGSDGRNTVAEASPNAISTLLHPPIVRTGLQPHNAVSGGGYKAPTQRDIPPVALTNIRHVEAKEFHPYLAQVGSLYEAFQRAKAETDCGETSLFHREKKNKDDDWESVLSKKLQRPPHSRQDSTSSSVTSPSETPRLSRRSSGQKRQAVTPLSTIPSVYSDEDFHLENPRTFDVVSERSEIVRDPNSAPSGRKSLATNAILQEKLSWYMDTVEVHLISSISTASKSFFSALGSLRELHAEAEDSVARIEKLRKELTRLDKEMAIDGLKVVNLKQRRDNIRRLSAAVLQLQDVVSAVQKCEDLVNRGELDGAMDDINAAERLMAGEFDNPNYKSQDLRQIRALEGALDDLNTLRSQVGKGYEARFHGTLLSDMRNNVMNTESKSTLQRWGIAFSRPKPGQRRAQSTVASYMHMDPNFREELGKEIQGLSRAKFTTPAVTTFRALVLKEMKSMIRKQLPSSNDDDSMSTVSASTLGGRRSQQEKSSLLARNLRALDDDDWYQMLVKVYTSISESLRRLSIQVKILLDVTSAIDQPQSATTKSPTATLQPDSGNPLSPRSGRPRSISIQAEMQQALDLSSLLGEAVDAAQVQLGKVLKVRSPQVSDMSLADFIRYFTLNKLFANECEAISGRSGAGLRSLLDVQIKDYVNQFGNRQLHSLVEVLDADKWEAKDFGERQSDLLNRIIEGSTSEPLAWSESALIWQEPSQTQLENGASSNGAVSKVRRAIIDEQKFSLSESPLTILQCIERSQHLATGIPTMGQEIMNSLLETLKLYNSRTNQLILGAGATKSAGLKTITTKHLALSSQGLSFVVALVPYIREFFRRYIPASSASQSLVEFDKVKRLFQEHQSAIHEKLIDIISNRSAIRVKAMKSIDWETAASDTSVQISPYMDILTKETATLQRVLVKFLPEATVMSIMSPVFDSYRKQWETAFDEVELKSEAAKERLLADVRVFDHHLSKLEGSGDLGKHIVAIVEAKSISGPSVTKAGEQDTTAEAATEPDKQSSATASDAAQLDESKTKSDEVPQTASSPPSQ